jgi:hypothetical protein
LTTTRKSVWFAISDKYDYRSDRKRIAMHCTRMLMIGTEGLGAGCPLAAGKCVEIAWGMKTSSMYIIAPNLFGRRRAVA